MAVKNNIPSQLHDKVFQTVTIVPADTTSFKTLFTAASSSDNSKEAHMYFLTISSDDTVSRDVQFAINDGSNDIIAGLVSIPALSGEAVATPPVSAIANRFTPVFARCFKDMRGNWVVPIYPG